MTTLAGCPEGMYPMDSTFPVNQEDSFKDLRAWAESVSDALNLPLSWYFDDEDTWRFTLYVYMPRKNKVCSVSCPFTVDSRAEIQEWLNTWLRGEINTWFGWDE